MRRPALLITGGLLTALGVLWTLQGFGVVGGSAMSGEVLWAFVGPFVALLGIVIAIRARRL
jgi:hypothetical protein